MTPHSPISAVGISAFSFLADASPSANAVMEFWLIVFGISGFLANCAMVAALFMRRKEKREISFEPEPASKTEFVSLRQAVAAQREADEKNASRSRAAMYEKMEELRKEIKEDIEHLRTENNAKMDALPERILNMLEKIYALKA